MTSDTRKSERFNPRMDAETREMLRELAEAHRESQASVVRRLIREAWRGLGVPRRGVGRGASD